MTLYEETGSGTSGAPIRKSESGNAVGVPIYQQVSGELVDAYLNDGLVAYYPFDGDVDDYSGQGNDGTDNTTAGFGAGRIGSDSKEFDGDNDRVELPDLGLQKSSSFSISAWANRDSSNGDCIFGRYDGSDDLLNFSYDAGSGTYDFSAGHVGGSRFDISATDNGENVWQHLTVVYDASGPTAKIYSNGSLSDSETLNIDDFNTTDGPWIGQRSDAAQSFDGRIDAVRVYGRMLSTREIDHIYQHGRVI